MISDEKIADVSIVSKSQHNLANGAEIDIFSELLIRQKEMSKRDKKQEETGIETVMLFVGQKQSGKSTLISSFLDKDELVAPSVALEYTFGRRTNPNGVKDISHIWELGSIF
jgi:putative ribosome biogenesis GTPase RsgA